MVARAVRSGLVPFHSNKARSPLPSTAPSLEEGRLPRCARMRPVEGRVASRILLCGLGGRLGEQTAAVVGALAGWRVLPGAPDHGASARPDPAIVLAWPFVVSRDGADGTDGLRVLLCAPWVTRIRRIAAED